MEENFEELFDKLEQAQKENKTKEKIILQKTREIQKKEAKIERLKNEISTKD